MVTLRPSSDPFVKLIDFKTFITEWYVLHAYVVPSEMLYDPYPYLGASLQFVLADGVIRRGVMVQTAPDEKCQTLAIQEHASFTLKRRRPLHRFDFIMGYRYVDAQGIPVLKMHQPKNLAFINFP